MIKSIRYFVFLALAALALTTTFLVSPLDKKLALDGVSNPAPEPEVSVSGHLSGKTQDEFTNWFQEHIPGRPFLVRFRNEISFGLLRTPPNNYYSMNMDGNLFTWGNVSSYMQYDAPISDADAIALAEKVANVRELFMQHGTELFVFITPCKVRYYDEELPLSDKLLLTNKDEGNYERLVKALKNTSVPYFDSIDYIDNHTFDERIPLYYRTNVHWAVVVGNEVGRAFGEYLEQVSGFDFPEITISAEPCDEPVYPDSDAYSVFNLLKKPYDNYYAPKITVTDDAGDHPDVFMRGGSFMGQSLSMLIRQGYFGKDVYFENSQLFRDNFSSVEVTHSYEELDMGKMLRGKDIVILEVNEPSIPNMSFGFIDYILEHTELLDEEKIEE